ncbi:malate dehydrogenase [Methanobacterium alcaliphilum]|uniref:malate dehydrogenase n=1 Tax=Methanobacterium alcaliphilum TaxID=392018 RepID=UPI00200AC397|nr:malate dehydrogenase [Methanobacterium alcaliphilum]MCK9151618.1 malate dehydrogenase [Methanobacterium alcaliphilum]
MKVSIIGSTGRVGKAAALCLAEEHAVNTLQLISREESLDHNKGEVLDIYDALAAKGVSITIQTSSDVSDVQGSQVVVITAGAPRTPDMQRMELGSENAKIIADYAKKIAKAAPDTIILVVTNPVDVMTYVALKNSGFPSSRVFGLGNHLDSLRLRNYMAEHFKVHVSEVHTRVIGQHGPYMVPLISSTSIGGIPIEYYSARDYFTDYKSFNLKNTIEKVINAGSNIISKKGATEYGPAFAISNIVNTILNDEKKILTVSTLMEGEIDGIKDVCLGVPVKLGENGIEGIVPVQMDRDEREALQDAADFIKKSTDEIMKELE